MKKKKIWIILTISALLMGACAVFDSENGAISGSGTIEATEYQIAAELGGKISQVHFDEGDSVQSGDLLFSLDSTLLEAQLAENQAAQLAAQANLDAAQANLELVNAQYQSVLQTSRALDEDARIDRWQDTQPAEFDLPVWFYSKEEELAAAQKDVDESFEAYQSELEQLEKILDDDSNEYLLALEAELVIARVAYENARTTLNRARNARDNDDLLDAAQDQFDTADSALDNAQDEYDALLSSEEYDDVLRARAEAAAARERYDTAQDTLDEFQSADESPEVLSASASIKLAEAQVSQAQAGLEQAVAAGNTLQVQLDKIQVQSPVDGVILYRNIDKGETITAGENVMTIAQLEEVNLVVYIPEEYYGQIQLGQSVLISSDSYPAEKFEGKVTIIADQAEFTPRNVQTVEGRKSTVYAITIAITNPDLKLKAGMPVDAAFQ